MNSKESFSLNKELFVSQSNFGQVLINFRLKNHLSLRELENISGGVKHPEILKLEKNKRNPRFNTVIFLGKGLGLTQDELLILLEAAGTKFKFADENMLNITVNNGNIGEKLKQYRLIKGFSLRDLARLSSVRHTDIMRIEKGSKPLAKNAVSIMNGLELTKTQVTDIIKTITEVKQ